MILEHLLETKDKRLWIQKVRSALVETWLYGVKERRQAMASVAQLTEASSCSQKVAGSIPGLGTCGRKQIDVSHINLALSTFVFL